MGAMTENQKFRALLTEMRRFVVSCPCVGLFCEHEALRKRIDEALAQPEDNHWLCGGGCSRVGILDGPDGVSRCADHDKKLHEALEKSQGTALANAEIFESALQDFAERDCAYGDNCPKFVGTRHGQCDSCKAKEALRSCNVPLRYEDL